MSDLLKSSFNLFPSKTSIWLFCCYLMIIAMAFIGAITRLTESGLSMVEWRPLIGMIPPLSEAEWSRVFGLYQLSPEYQKINLGMSLSEFKHIFFWEWFHRLWGQIMGFVLLLPLLYLTIRQKRPRNTLIGYWGIFILGLLQGFIGWYMVKSGLVDRPSVSHYRLAFHLMTAAVIANYTLYLFYKKTGLYQQIKAPRPLITHLKIDICLILITMTFGALTAGLDGGMIYNSFPKMDAFWLPEEFYTQSHTILSWLNEPGIIQFCHRCFALTTLVSITLSTLQTYALDLKLRPLSLLQFGLLFLQIGLGVYILCAQVPVMPSSLHQMIAFLLLSTRFATLWTVMPYESEPRKY